MLKGRLGTYMDANLHSSLPFEYQLKYGTACGNLDVAQLMNNAAAQGIWSPDSGLSEEIPLRFFWSDARAFSVDIGNSCLISLDRR